MNYIMFVLLLCLSPNESQAVMAPGVGSMLACPPKTNTLNLTLPAPRYLTRENSFGFDNPVMGPQRTPSDRKQTIAAATRRAPRRHVDLKFLTVTAGIVAATAFEIESTQNCVRRGTCSPIVGKSRTRQYAIKMSLASVVVAATYLLKRDDDRMADKADRRGWGGATGVWWLPAAGYSSVFVGRGIYNHSRLN